MPTASRIKSYTFFFYSSNGKEPYHIHVRKNNAIAKFWLIPVCLHKSRNFNDHELRELQRIVEKNRDFFLEVWDEYFGN